MVQYAISLKNMRIYRLYSLNWFIAAVYRKMFSDKFYLYGSRHDSRLHFNVPCELRTIKKKTFDRSHTHTVDTPIRVLSSAWVQFPHQFTTFLFHYMYTNNVYSHTQHRWTINMFRITKFLMISNSFSFAYFRFFFRFSFAFFFLLFCLIYWDEIDPIQNKYKLCNYMPSNIL